MAASSFLTISPFSPISYHGYPNLSIRPFRPFVHAAMPADMSSSSNIIQPSPATYHDKLFHATPLPPLSVHGFYLPQILCGFPAMRNPHYESFKERLFSWLFEWAEPETETQRIFMIESDIPGLVCSILPKCKRLDRLELLCRLCLWVGCIDDICDDPSGGEAKTRPFGEVVNLFEKAMEGHKLAATSDGGHIKAICSILEAIRHDASPRLYKRLVKGIGSFLRSSQSEVSTGERERLISWDVSTYISCRRRSFAFDMIEVIMEYGMGVELDEECLEMESMKELQNAAADYIAWTNDVLSFRKEYVTGDLNNLLPTLYFHRRMSSDYNCNKTVMKEKYEFQDAVDEACDMIERKERDFIGLLNEVRVSNESMRKPEVDVYVESLPYLLSGHLEWYYTSARFHGVGHSVKNVREGYFVMDPHTTIVLPRSPSITT